MKNLLTPQQWRWICYRKINVGDFYSFPRWGITVFESPDSGSAHYIDSNPFTKSLDNEFFLVKEKRNGFCRGNFYDRPNVHDWWMLEADLQRRDLVAIVLILVIVYIPLALYNAFVKVDRETCGCCFHIRVFFLRFGRKDQAWYFKWFGRTVWVN